MPVPIDLLRAVLGLLCVFFAHWLGRSAARARRGGKHGLFRWTVRTVLTGLAVAWRYGLDGVMIAVLLGAAASAGLGAWLESRPPKPGEDLSEQIVPKD